jgi:hypothetical protein
MNQRNCGCSVAYCVMVEGDCPSCETLLCPGVTNNAMHTVTRVVTSTSTNTNQIVIGLACDSEVPLFRAPSFEVRANKTPIIFDHGKLNVSTNVSPLVCSLYLLASP